MEKTAGPALFSARADGAGLSEGGGEPPLGSPRCWAPPLPSALSLQAARFHLPTLPPTPAPSPALSQWGCGELASELPRLFPVSSASVPGPRGIAGLCRTTAVFQLCSCAALGRPVRLWPSRTEMAFFSLGAQRQRQERGGRGPWRW